MAQTPVWNQQDCTHYWKLEPRIPNQEYCVDCWLTRPRPAPVEDMPDDIEDFKNERAERMWPR